MRDSSYFNILFFGISDRSNHHQSLVASDWLTGGISAGNDTLQHPLSCRLQLFHGGIGYHGDLWYSTSQQSMTSLVNGHLLHNHRAASASTSSQRTCIHILAFGFPLMFTLFCLTTSQVRIYLQI